MGIYIFNLPSATTLEDGDYFPISNAGITKKVVWSTISATFGSASDVTTLNSFKSTLDSLNGVLRGDGAGGYTTATIPNVDSTNNLLKGNGTGDAIDAEVSASDVIGAIASVSSHGATLATFAGINGLIKGDGSNNFAVAIPDTDYATPSYATNYTDSVFSTISGAFTTLQGVSGIIKGDGTGGFAAAIGGTDFATIEHTTNILVGDGSGNGVNSTIDPLDVTHTIQTDNAICAVAGIIIGDGNGAFVAAVPDTDYATVGYVDAQVAGVTPPTVPDTNNLLAGDGEGGFSDSSLVVEDVTLAKNVTQAISAIAGIVKSDGGGAFSAAAQADIEALGIAPLDSPHFTGEVTAPTVDISANDTSVATTAFVHDVEALLAPLDSPDFTGSPTAPTQDISDISTKIATTEYVENRFLGITLPAVETTTNVLIGDGAGNAVDSMVSIASLGAGWTTTSSSDTLYNGAKVFVTDAASVALTSTPSTGDCIRVATNSAEAQIVGNGNSICIGDDTAMSSYPMQVNEFVTLVWVGDRWWAESNLIAKTQAAEDASDYIATTQFVHDVADALATGTANTLAWYNTDGEVSSGPVYTSADGLSSLNMGATGIVVARSLYFSDSGAVNYISLTGNPTASRTMYLPDKDGTVVVIDANNSVILPDGDATHPSLKWVGDSVGTYGFHFETANLVYATGDGGAVVVVFKPEGLFLNSGHDITDDYQVPHKLYVDGAISSAISSLPGAGWLYKDGDYTAQPEEKIVAVASAVITLPESPVNGQSCQIASGGSVCSVISNYAIVIGDQTIVISDHYYLQTQECIQFVFTGTAWQATSNRRVATSTSHDDSVATTNFVYDRISTVDSGWDANGDDGTKGATIPTFADTELYVGAGTGFNTAYPDVASLISGMAEQIKALRAALRDNLRPNT